MRSQAKALFLVFVGEKKNTAEYLGKEFNHSIATLEFFLYCSAIVDEIEQNIVICQWWAVQLFAEAEGWGK